MRTNFSTPLVSIEWLSENIDNPNIIVLNATLAKVTDKDSLKNVQQIKNARFFDIKNVFSDTSSILPNTFPSAEKFQNEARKLGINNDSLIVVYDYYGFYSCARAWWLFKSFGHKNVAVLDGGLPIWNKKKLPTEEEKIYNGLLGDFVATYQKNSIKNYKEVLQRINEKGITILDARAANRFIGSVPEPREGLRSGHIPNAKNMPFSELIRTGKFISDAELKTKFEALVKQDQELILSCGSGVTACILALGAEKMGYKHISVYDGSWTEWGSNHELPIEVGSKR